MTRDVVERLLAAPQGFNLFQAISLLERAASGTTGDASSQAASARGAVRLSSHVSLAFEPSDIRSVTRDCATGEAFLLRTPVLSLAGVGGPLPQPFTELLLERQARRDYATADFLDIFNHRLLSFLYRSRRKHHMALGAERPSQTSLATTLDAISALGLQGGIRAPGGSSQWLSHAGLLGGAPRSMAGLLAILRDRLGVVVHGTQFCGAWLSLETDATARLSRRPGHVGVRLDGQSILGRRVWDQGAGVRLHFSHLSQPQFDGLLPGGGDHALAQWLLKRYVPQDLKVRMELQLARTEVRKSVLSSRSPMRLGWTSWLTGSKHSGPLAPVTVTVTVTVALSSAVA